MWRGGRRAIGADLASATSREGNWGTVCLHISRDVSAAKATGLDTKTCDARILENRHQMSSHDPVESLIKTTVDRSLEKQPHLASNVPLNFAIDLTASLSIPPIPFTPSLSLFPMVYLLTAKAVSSHRAHGSFRKMGNKESEMGSTGISVCGDTNFYAMQPHATTSATSPELPEPLYLHPRMLIKAELGETFGKPTATDLMSLVVTLTLLSAELIGWRRPSDEWRGYLQRFDLIQ
nr:hypothetical protein CFP56_68124 [Quercus suber]